MPSADQDFASEAFLLLLSEFVQDARLHTWLHGENRVLSYRPHAHDLQYAVGDFSYLDSYFGTQDFFGQEVVYWQGQPVWVMNYQSRIIRPDLFSGAQAAAITREGRGEMYQQRGFLRGFTKPTAQGTYTDESRGDLRWFQGREWIQREGLELYEFVYAGGLIRD